MISVILDKLFVMNENQKTDTFVKLSLSLAFNVLVLVLCAILYNYGYNYMLFVIIVYCLIIVVDYITLYVVKRKILHDEIEELDIQKKEGDGEEEDGGEEREIPKTDTSDDLVEEMRDNSFEQIHEQLKEEIYSDYDDETGDQQIQYVEEFNESPYINDISNPSEQSFNARMEYEIDFDRIKDEAINEIRQEEQFKRQLDNNSSIDPEEIDMDALEYNSTEFVKNSIKLDEENDDERKQVGEEQMEEEQMDEERKESVGESVGVIELEITAEQSNTTGAFTLP
jgi:hypothetical protein